MKMQCGIYTVDWLRIDLSERLGLCSRSSNFGSETGYIYCYFHGFPQLLKANTGIVLQIRRDCFLPHNFQFITYYRALYNL
jgi:hypothetical protein